MKEVIIISPHCDDECIGAYKFLKEATIIIYDAIASIERRNEALTLKSKMSNIKAQLFQNTIPSSFLNKENMLLFPCIEEVHPLHRKWSYMGEQLSRNGLNIIFYTINMNVPYIREVEDIKGKEDLLNSIYPSQSDMWKYEKKYVIWEGFCKWIF